MPCSCQLQTCFCTWLSQVQIHSRRWRAQAGPSAPSRAAQPHRFLGPQLEAQRQRWLLALQADWQMKPRYPSGTHTRPCREDEQLQLLQAVWTGIEERQRSDSLCQLDLYMSFLFGPESACGVNLLSLCDAMSGLRQANSYQQGLEGRAFTG